MHNYLYKCMRVQHYIHKRTDIQKALRHTYTQTKSPSKQEINHINRAFLKTFCSVWRMRKHET